jgi:hypothetical protein
LFLLEGVVTSSSSSIASEYSSKCSAISCRILSSSNAKIAALALEGGGGAGGAAAAQQSLKGGPTAKASAKGMRSAAGLNIVPDFGARAEEITNAALSEFATDVPPPPEGFSVTYDSSLEALEKQIDSSLLLLYTRQLCSIRERALQRYKQLGAASESGGGDYDAMLQADDYFVKEAEEATRVGSDWDYAAERNHLQGVMSDIASSGKKLLDVKLESARQQSSALQFLQLQQQQIQQMQMQLYGQTSPLNVGFAYRIPDSNINIQGQHQQGRTNFQISCVADEYAAFLGPNGFVNGVGPGNLGISCNLSI